MIQLLGENPLLLLFVVASLGYLIGTIKFKGASLGVAGILFTGLVFGAIDPTLQIPEIVLLLGLAIFVYSIGLSSGPAFFNAHRTNKTRDFLFIISTLIFSGLIAAALWFFFGFSAAAIAGIYSGSTTNTAALAGVIDIITNSTSPESGSELIQDAVVGYSFSYPMGVLGGIIAILLLEKLLNIDYDSEKTQLRKTYPLDEELTSSTVEITNPEVCGQSLRDLFKKYDWNVVFGRLYQDGNITLSNWDSSFSVGDSIMVVGSPEEIEFTTQTLGRPGDVSLSHDRKAFDVRRIFVSNPMLVGRSISSLNIKEKYNAVITRIRRGDMEMLARGDTIIELGDRIRFIARREDLKELSEFFGDSYHKASRINVFTFGLGIGLGLLLGNIEISIGSNFSFTLGYAGGPLIVGLMLGAIRRTGSITWTLPYSANVTLQQIGLMLLLAAIGVRSGNAFVQSLSMDGLFFFIAGTIISLLTAMTILFIGYRTFKMPFTLLSGIVSNQPAILDFATSRAKNRIPEIGYTLMFPIAVDLQNCDCADLVFVIEMNSKIPSTIHCP